MRISDDRYSRDRQRYDLALRFIRHEARTRTVKTWTGLSDDRIRKLYRSYLSEGGSTSTIRHRGMSPHQVGYFVRSPLIRQEASVLASMCYLHAVLPGTPLDNAVALPDVRRGVALCEAFETYQRMVTGSRISFEHAVFLVMALDRGDELQAARCAGCSTLMVRDRYNPAMRRCGPCESWAPLAD
jgi:hypothetical protein